MINLIKKLLNLNFYVSEIDHFLSSYDHAHQRHSKSQQREMDKYQRINQLRDCATPAHKDSTIWDRF